MHRDCPEAPKTHNLRTSTERGSQAGSFPVSAALRGPSSHLAACVAVLRALSSPGLHSSLPELLTSFSGFQQVIHRPEAAHMVWNNLSPLLPWSPPRSQRLCRHSCSVRDGWPALYFSFLEGSSLSTAVPLKILLSHTGIYSISCTPPLHKCLICRLSKPLSSPSNTCGMCVPPSRLRTGCCDPNIFLFGNPSFSPTVAF